MLPDFGLLGKRCSWRYWKIYLHSCLIIPNRFDSLIDSLLDTCDNPINMHHQFPFYCVPHVVKIDADTLSSGKFKCRYKIAISCNNHYYINKML